MNNPHSQIDEALQLLEEELRALTPAAPSDGLRARIQDALLHAADEAPAAPVTPPTPVWFGWIPIAAAAAVALLAVVLTPGIGRNPATSNPLAANTDPVAIDQADLTPVDWQPLASNSKLERIDYEGVRQQDSSTYRQIRTRYMERRTYKNPKDGSTVEILVPREEVRLVPVVPE